MSNKIKEEIFNGVGENVRALAQLFPSAVKDGEVDFSALKQELGEFVEVGAEKYEFTWSGKAKAKAEALTDILGRTLKYKKGAGVDENTTKNIYIEGDNLEALKLLRNSYYNKIKMIYIDPPYNTGNDFVYKDNFAMTEEEKQAMAEAGEEVDEYGERLVKNSCDNSKYHTNWLNMVYPRLKLAKDLLTDDGVIFISIDDNEQANLRKLCNEVFGENNFVACLPTVMNLKGNNDQFGFSGTHEYTLVYMKNVLSIEDLNGIDLTADEKKEYTLCDKNGKYKQGATLMRTGEAGARVFRPKGYYPIYVREDLSELSINRMAINDYIVYPKTRNGIDMSWRRSPENLQNTRNEFIIKRTNGAISFYKKQRLEDDIRTGKKAKTIFYKTEYSSGNGTALMIELFKGRIFDNPKPLSLIKDFIKIGSNKDSLILDFFSGSATTAHAVMMLNSEDGGNRKYICVQLPESCAKDKEAFKAGYKNICEIGRERIRRAGKEIKEDRNIKMDLDRNQLMQRNQLDNGGFEDKYAIKITPCPDDDILDNLDIGFKVFKVADTNIKMFSNELNNVDLLGQFATKDIDPEQIDFNNGATDIDVCYELLLRHRGIPLSSKVDKLSIGERTYIIADSIVVCLDKQVTESLIEQLAAIAPLPNKYIFRDSSFGDDISLKENTMIHLQAIIEKNSGISKKTYTVEFI